MSILAAHDLTCSYRGRPVFTDVSLAVNSGEMLSIIGPNGAGKTTLLRALLGLIPPTRGRVTLADRDLSHWSAGQIAQIVAFAPQGLMPDWPFRVREFVALGRAPHRGWLRPLGADDRDAVDTSLEKLGLASFHDRLVTELSGGEWQRVRLARALAQRPRVLLLDEPTAHLDPRHQLEFLTALRSLTRDDGVAVIITMHDLNLAGPWSDRVALLAGGTLLADGLPSEVITPELLEKAYGVRLAVAPHPLTGVPAVSAARLLP